MCRVLCPWALYVERKMRLCLIGTGLSKKKKKVCADKLEYVQRWMHLVAFQRFVLKPVLMLEWAKYKDICKILCTCCLPKVWSGLRSWSCHVAHVAVKAASQRGWGGWGVGGVEAGATETFPLRSYPCWVCLFQSAICFVLHPFQFVYIWLLLERGSVLIDCPCFLGLALRKRGKKKQNPVPLPFVLIPCSYIVSSGCWLLLLIYRPGRGPAQLSKSLARKKVQAGMLASGSH